MLTVSSVSFAYKKNSTAVLKDISLTLEMGNVIGILGPNGTGKSTLLKCLNYIHRPQKGNVLLNGVDIGTVTVKERAKLFSYVPQYFDTNVSMTVFDTVLLGRLPYVTYSYTKADYDIAWQAMVELNIQDLAMKDMRNLSGGQQQRAYIARAVAGSSSVILLDEPSSSLDIKNQLLVMDELRQLAHSKHLLIIMTIHDLNLASMYCDEIIMLKDSQLYAKGKPEEVLTSHRIKEVYGVNTTSCVDEDTVYIHLKHTI